MGRMLRCDGERRIGDFFHRETQRSVLSLGWRQSTTAQCFKPRLEFLERGIVHVALAAQATQDGFERPGEQLYWPAAALSSRINSLKPMASTPSASG